MFIISSVATKHLSLLLESLREAADVVRESALVAKELNVGTIDPDLTLLALLDVLVALERGETPVLGDDDLLATRELHFVSMIAGERLIEIFRTLYWQRLRASRAVAR